VVASPPGSVGVVRMTQRVLCRCEVFLGLSSLQALLWVLVLERGRLLGMTPSLVASIRA
jgi:hypothetical protein